MNEENANQVGDMIQAMMDKEKQEKARRFHYLNAYVKKKQIVFAGSSLMEQFPIYEFLLDEGLPFTIYNRGIGGLTSLEMQSVMDACLYELDPKVIFLNIGTNDLNDPSCTLDELMRRYGLVLGGIKEHLPGARLFLLAYYPVNPEAADDPMMQEVLRSRTNEKIRSANERVQRLAKDYGATYLDLNQDLTDEKGNLKKELTVEGMHMYANGYRHVFERLLPTLKSL